MLVKIIKYDPVKGRGIYQEQSGTEKTFTYRQLKDQKIISPGQLASLTKGKFLGAACWKGRLKWHASKLFKGNI